MGLSSSSSKQTSNSTSTATPYSAAQPYIDSGLAAANQTFNQQQPVLNDLASTAQSAFNSLAPGIFQTSPYVTAAQSAATNLFNSGTNNNPGSSTYSSIAGSTNPALTGLTTLAGTSSLGAGAGTLSTLAGGGSVGSGNDAASYDADVLSGKYLNNNPYIDAITQQATDAATKATNQRFGASGLGQGLSSAYTGALGSAVANANNSTRYTAYSAERQLQDAASARVSSNYNAGQDRALSAANGLQTASQNDRADQLAASTALGSLYNTGQQTQLAAAQAADSSYNAQQQQILAALGLTGSLSDAQYAGVNPGLNLLNSAASIPYYGLNAYSGTLNTLAGKYGTTTGTGSSTTTTTPSLGSMLGNAVSNGLQAYAMGG